MNLMLEKSEMPDDLKFVVGKGCDNCNNIGYKGRLPLFEMMLFSERIAELVEQKASTGALREVALEEGMMTLRQSGIMSIFDGVTSVDEVVKETITT